MGWSPVSISTVLSQKALSEFTDGGGEDGGKMLTFLKILNIYAEVLRKYCHGALLCCLGMPVPTLLVWIPK